MRIGGIEAGGTKMICAIAEILTDSKFLVDAKKRAGVFHTEAEDIRILERVSIPTEAPEITLPKMIDFFQGKGIEALGIGCFGPVDLNRQSKTYGCIKQTPKQEWADCNVVGRFKDALKVPVGFDTDVNAAVFGEVLWGAAKDCESAIYITIGTGVGVGVYCNGRLLHGLAHPEAGHILLERHSEDAYAGKCPFHKNCFEGLASGPAIEARWGKPAAELADCKGVWEMEAFYITQAVTNYILTYSPEKIVLWGGVMHQKQLFSMVRSKVRELLAGYVEHPLLNEGIENYIIEPELGENPGIMGAFGLGLQELCR